MRHKASQISPCLAVEEGTTVLSPSVKPQTKDSRTKGKVAAQFCPFSSVQGRGQPGWNVRDIRGSDKAAWKAAGVVVPTHMESVPLIIHAWFTAGSVVWTWPNSCSTTCSRAQMWSRHTSKPQFKCLSFTLSRVKRNMLFYTARTHSVFFLLKVLIRKVHGSHGSLLQ